MRDRGVIVGYMTADDMVVDEVTAERDCEAWLCDGAAQSIAQWICAHRLRGANARSDGAELLRRKTARHD
jgi:hypothetical protein